MGARDFKLDEYVAGVKNWAGGRSYVLVSALCRGIGVGRGRASSPDFPLDVHVRGGRKIVLVGDILAHAPKEWLAMLAKSPPLPLDSYENTVKRIEKFMPEFLNDEITMSDIAREVKLTRERVRQIILSEFGETARSETRISARRERGASKELTHAQIREKNRIATNLRRYGAQTEELERRFGADWKKSYHDFLQTRRNALIHKGTEWNATYADWLETWNSADNPEGTGRLCFTRIDRSLPYEKGNLRIIRMSKLIKEVRLQEKSYRPMGGVKVVHAKHP